MKIVRITAMRKTGKQIEAGPPFPRGHLIDQEQQYLPPIYNTRSTLTAENLAGRNSNVDFNLEPVK